MNCKFKLFFDTLKIIIFFGCAQSANAQDCDPKLFTIKAEEIHYEMATVTKIEGAPIIYTASMVGRPLKVGDKVYDDELMTTDKNSSIILKAKDNSTFVVQKGSEFKFLKQTPEKSSLIGELFIGSMRYLRYFGQKIAPMPADIVTPTAVLGDRGTEHRLSVIKDAAKGHAAGTYDQVFSGKTQLTNKFGAVDILPNHIGFAPKDSAPRLLK